MDRRPIAKVFEELGLVSLWDSTIDAKLLCVQRFVRLFAYSSTNLILVQYLSILGITKAKIGLFMTLTIVGDTVISFLLTLFADRLGRKQILALGAALMIGSGIVFASTGNYWFLLVAAIVGVISPSGNEIGPFRAIEESTLAHLVPPANRGDVYAWYSLSGSVGTAFGFITSGWLIHFVQDQWEWDELRTYRSIFWAYAVLGAVKLILALALSKAVELEEQKPAPAQASETTALLGDGTEEAKPNKWSIRSILPNISEESVGILVNLCILFALDSFASALASLSWFTFFFHDKFNLEAGKLGSLFFTTSIISGMSMILASSIAKRLGNVKTMVFTHLPSAIFLALIPLPNYLPLAILFLVLRSCSQQMDVAPRAAFMAAVVLPHERTAVLGVVNVFKASAQSLGPLITGILAQHHLLWVSFVTAGSLKVTYDLGMLAMFANHKTRDDRAEEQRQAEEEETLRGSEGDEP